MVAALGLACGLCTGSARAQALPEAVVTSGDLSAGNKAEINTFVTAHIKGLTAATPEEIKRARGALVGPLRTGGVSGSFRTEYSGALDKAGLAGLAADQRDEVAINALRIASELGTGRSLEILRAGLNDPRQAVRTMAAMGFGRALGTARAGNRTLLDLHIRDALKTIREGMNDKQDPVVLDALVMSLAEIMQIPADTGLMAGLQNAAAGVAVDGVAGVAPTARPEHAPALTRATAAMITALADPKVTLQPDTLKKAAGLAGDALVFTSWRLDSGELPQDERERLAVLADQSARVIQLTSAKLSGPKAPETRLRDSVLAGNAAQFKTEAAAYINVLTERTVGLPADRFKSRR